MNIIILDDDILFLNTFKNKIQHFAKKIFNDVTIDISTNTSILQNKTYSIYFLDIDLINENGIAVATNIKRLNASAIIIFTTARNDLIYNAITVQPFYFIRKSELDNDLATAFILLKDYFIDKPFFSFKYESEQIKLYIEDIIFFETNDHLTTIFTNSKQYHLYTPLKKLMNLLNSPNIIQANRNQCINVAYVIQEKGNYLILDNSYKIKIGKKYKDNLKYTLNNYLMSKDI